MALQGSSGFFDVINEISWHSLWYPGGPAFAAEGYADGDQLTNIPDEGTNGHDASDSAASRAIYDASDTRIQGQRTLKFTGSGSGGEFDTGSFGESLSTQFTCVAVVYPSNLSVKRTLLTDRTTPTNFAISIESDGDVTVTHGGASVTTTNQPAPEDNTHSIMTIMSPSGETDKVWVNGTREINSSLGDVSPAGINIGGSSSGTEDWVGSVAFIGLYVGDLTEDTKFSGLQDWMLKEFGATL